MPSSSKTHKREPKKRNLIKQRINKCKVNGMTDEQFDLFRDGQIKLTREKNKNLLNSMTNPSHLNSMTNPSHSSMRDEYHLFWAECLYENHLYIAALKHMPLTQIQSLTQKLIA